jgi:hypothetical protein
MSVPSTPLALLTPRTSPDIFDKFALTEEQTTPVSPIRRNRPGETALPASKTNRELTTEIERLKDNLMTSKMRVELLKKNNHELQMDLTKAKEDAEQLEILEEENATLSNENHLMKVKLDRYEDELLRLRDTNQDLREANEALVTTNNESVQQFDTQDAAFTEAIEIIATLEEEKEALKQELQEIKVRVSAIETSNNPRSQVDGNPSYPTRICSIDETCPSTTHFDSDYYSQPASPRGDTDKISIRSNHSMSTSMRSRRFRELSLQHRQSAQDLTTRMSQASLRATSLRSSVLQVDVTQPEHKQADPRRPENTVSLAKHRRRDPSSLEDRAATVTPQLKVPRPSGLRAMYNPSEATGRRQLQTRCSSLNHDLSPSNSTRTRSRRSSTHRDSLPAPPRTSSKHAYTGSLDQHATQHSHSSIGMDFSPTSETLVNAELSMSEWASPALGSVVSDLTSVPDPRDKDRWWKSVERLTQADAKGHAKGESGDAAHLKTFRARNQLNRAVSSPYAGTRTGFEEDDQFLKRVQARFFKRKESMNATS